MSETITESIEHLDFESIINCEGTMQIPDCLNEVKWLATRNSCCHAIRLICDEHKEEIVEWYKRNKNKKAYCPKCASFIRPSIDEIKFKPIA